MIRASAVHYSKEPLSVIYGLHLGDHRYRYIGMTTAGTKRRFSQHRRSSGRSDSKHRPVYCWMRKHGIDSIHIDVIEICNDKSLLPSREAFWIKYYRDLNFNLLNVSDGGGGILSDTGKDKILSALAGNNHALGYKHTEEAIARIGKASIGNQHALGYNHTEEARQKISEAHRGKSRPHSKRTAHIRWHINKNVSKPETCKFCEEEKNDTSNESS